MPTPIDFTGPSRVYAATIAATSGAVAAFSANAQYTVSAWSPIDSWTHAPWSPTSTYQAGATVLYGQHLYISDVNGNVGNQPGLFGSLWWSLAPTQPQFVFDLQDPTDGTPSQMFVPFVFPTGAVMQVKNFNEAGFVATNWTAITSGALVTTGGGLTLLGFSGVNAAPMYTGVNY